jgi:hypothetical protein
LTSLAEADYNSRDSAISVDIWIDSLNDYEVVGGTEHRILFPIENSSRLIELRRLHNRVVSVARAWHWPYGDVRIHARDKWVGLRRQWLEADDSGNPSGSLILEDDLEVSPLFFQWWRDAIAAYGGRPDVAGVTLQRAQLVLKGGVYDMPEVDSAQYPLFLYKLVGTWGFAPVPAVWARFLRWYGGTGGADAAVGVDGLHSSIWLETDIARGKAQSMWMQHFVKFCDEEGLYIVHANLPGGKALASHHQESGEHFDGTAGGTDSVLQVLPTSILSRFPQNPLMLDWRGQPVRHNFSLPVTSRRLDRYGHVAKPAASDSCNEKNTITFTKVSDLPSLGQLQLAYICVAIAAGLLALKHVLFQQPHQAKRFTSSTCVIAIALLCAFCNVVAPTMPRPPATPASQPENLDLWCTSMFTVLVISLSWTRTVPSKEQVPLNRAQCNEWKGWMMLSFVLYHVCLKPERMYSSVLFVPIRMMVSAYIWMTGFGHGLFFWSKANFSVKRFFEMYWRMNFFGVSLAMATGTPWLDYYIMALHTTHFTMIWLTLLIASKIAPEIGSKQKIVGIVVYATLITLSFETSTVWGNTVGPVLNTVFGQKQATDFYERLVWDRWSSFYGLIFSAAYPFISRQVEEKGTRVYPISSAVSLVALLVFTVASHLSTDYMVVHPYIGTLPILIYLLLRNWTSGLIKRVSVPLEWIGEISLELYLLQFHLLMNRSAFGLLVAIPGGVEYGMLNTALVTAPFSYFASQGFKLTVELKKYAFKLSRFGIGFFILQFSLVCFWGYLAMSNRVWLLGSILNAGLMTKVKHFGPSVAGTAEMYNVLPQSQIQIEPVCASGDAEKLVSKSNQSDASPVTPIEGKADGSSNEGWFVRLSDNTHGAAAGLTMFVVLCTTALGGGSDLTVAPQASTTVASVSQAISFSSSKRLVLMIGDSVSRYANQDYCARVDGVLSNHENWGSGTQFSKGTFERLILDSGPGYANVFEPNICRTNHTVFISIFGGFFSNPYGPWNWYSAAGSAAPRLYPGFYSEVVSKISTALSPKEALENIYGPVLRAILGAAPSDRTWIMYNSNAWDHSHLFWFQSYYGTYSTLNLEAYSKFWKANTTRAIDFMLDLAPALRANRQVLLWTLSNVAPKAQFPRIQAFTAAVNQRTRELSAERFFLLDFNIELGNRTDFRRDDVHPSPRFTALLTETATEMMARRDVYLTATK